jgi:DNA-binding MarR family transcriptional regulator
VARDEALQELRESLHEVLASLRRLRGRDSRDAHGLTFSQYRLLVRLACEDELPAGALAAAAELTPATVTQMLDALVAAGIVERTRSEVDRRQVLNRLTPEGRRLQEAKDAELAQSWEAAFEGVSEHELREGLRILERVQRFVDRA